MLKSLIQDSSPVYPPAILLYGSPGIGKTTFGANARGPVFILTEDGLAGKKVPCFPKAKTFAEVCQFTQLLIDERHGYQTLVLDSASGVDTLVKDSILLESGAKTLASVGAYGLGYALLGDRWNFLVQQLDLLRAKRSMCILILGHADLTSAEDAEYGTFDRWTPSIYKKGQKAVVEWCDLVGYATRRMTLTSVDNGRRSVASSVGGDERIVHYNGTPAILAKNRFGITEKLPLAWEPLYEVFSQQVAR